MLRTRTFFNKGGCLNFKNHNPFYSSHNFISTTKLKSDVLPIINIQEFLSSNHSNRTLAEHKELIHELKEIASNIGFFYITGFNQIISQDLINSAFKEIEIFFNLPLDEKMKIHISRTPYLRGYMRIGDQGHYGMDISDKRLDSNEQKLETVLYDMKEVFTMGQMLDFNHPHFHNLLFGPNVFGLHSTNFKSIIEEYYNSVLFLSNELFQLFAIALDLEYNYFDHKIDEGMNSLNCLHYMPLERNEVEQCGISAHTDFECFTLLAQDIESPCGLEVLMSTVVNGNSCEVWTSFPPVENTFVVNFGDIMARMSNDRFRSTVHRAMNDEFRHRYSMAFFRHCNFDVRIENLIVDENAKYEPIIAGEHMLERVSVANENENST